MEKDIKLLLKEIAQVNGRLNTAYKRNDELERRLKIAHDIQKNDARIIRKLERKIATLSHKLNTKHP